MTDISMQAWLDQENRHVARIIRERGCYIQYVFGCPDDEGCLAGCGRGRT